MKSKAGVSSSSSTSRSSKRPRDDAIDSRFLRHNIMNNIMNLFISLDIDVNSFCAHHIIDLALRFQGYMHGARNIKIDIQSYLTLRLVKGL